MTTTEDLPTIRLYQHRTALGGPDGPRETEIWDRLRWCLELGGPEWHPRRPGTLDDDVLESVRVEIPAICMGTRAELDLDIRRAIKRWERDR